MGTDRCPFGSVKLKPLLGGVLAAVVVLVCGALGALVSAALVVTLLSVTRLGGFTGAGTLLDCAVWGGAGLGLVIGCLWARAILRSP